MNECNIIKDLLPLYIDDVLSEDSREMVEKHLEECEECANELKELKENKIDIPLSADAQKRGESIIKGLKKKLLNKKIIIAVVSICVMIGIFIGVYAAMFTTRIPIKYDSAKMKVIEQNGDLYLSYDGYFYGSVEYADRDDYNYEHHAIYLYEVPYTKYIKPLRSSKKKPELIFLEKKSIVDEVYYGDFENMPEEGNPTKFFNKNLNKIYKNNNLDKSKKSNTPKG